MTMEDQTAASPEAGDATVSPTESFKNDTNTDSALDEDAALEAIYDRITETPAAPEEAAAATDPDQPQKAEGAPDFTPASGPPNSWSAEMKGTWDAIPPEARAYIAQREMEAHDQISRMGQEVARFRPLSELIDTRLEVFDRHGIEPTQGLAALLDAQDRLDNDPIDGIAAIADRYGIDLAATFGGQQQGQQADPQVRALAHQVRTLQQQLALRETSEKTKAQREAEARREEAKVTVTKWGEGKTHFARPEVKSLMGKLMSSGDAIDLDDAYDKACHALPEVRKLVTAEASKQALADQAKAAADAKRNRGVNSGSRPGPTARSGSWDDDANLGAIFDRIAS